MRDLKETRRTFQSDRRKAARVIGLGKTDQATRALAHRGQVEAATLDYVDWYNH